MGTGRRICTRGPVLGDVLQPKCSDQRFQCQGACDCEVPRRNVSPDRDALDNPQGRLRPVQTANAGSCLTVSACLYLSLILTCAPFALFRQILLSVKGKGLTWLLPCMRLRAFSSAAAKVREGDNAWSSEHLCSALVQAAASVYLPIFWPCSFPHDLYYDGQAR